jgi:hypothetical protein
VLKQANFMFNPDPEHLKGSTSNRGLRSFGFGQRPSSLEVYSNSASERKDNSIRVHQSASEAASEEQGNSSMCSFEGYFVNVAEE